MKKVVITDDEGKVTETVVSTEETARSFENLPFETKHIVSVSVEDA